ncbi:MAG TPA: DUF1439 domain-containing protein [Ramlibacter sp.]|nr:DUF1439 domain-containing protein [Ramlibacter sp.]
MNRRQLASFSVAILLDTQVAAQVESTQPRHKVSAARLHQALEQHFPKRIAVGGLFDLTLRSPLLHLLPVQNRLAVELEINAGGAALRRSYDGSFDIDFSLRYEASDRTVRAHRLRVRSLRFPGLAPNALQVLEAYSQRLADDVLLEVVVHQLDPRDLALPDAMGLQPGTITVTAEGLVIGFVPKTAR